MAGDPVPQCHQYPPPGTPVPFMAEDCVPPVSLMSPVSPVSSLCWGASLLQPSGHQRELAGGEGGGFWLCWAVLGGAGRRWAVLSCAQSEGQERETATPAGTGTTHPGTALSLYNPSQCNPSPYNPSQYNTSQCRFIPVQPIPVQLIPVQPRN